MDTSIKAPAEPIIKSAEPKPKLQGNRATRRRAAKLGIPIEAMELAKPYLATAQRRIDPEKRKGIIGLYEKAKAVKAAKEQKTNAESRDNEGNSGVGQIDASAPVHDA